MPAQERIMTSEATTADHDNDKSAKLKAGLVETNQKVEASLLTSIEEHLQNHSSKAGLDFLHVKNSLLLSYLIDLTLYLKQKLSGKKTTEDNLKRLNEMKVVLDKMRGLDKKLRYQIDKLLQAENAAAYASSGVQNAEENGNNNSDPLQYRPDPKALRVNDGEDSSSSSSDEGGDSENEGSEEEAGGDDDDDLAAARMTVAMSRGKQKTSKGRKKNQEDEDDDNDDEPGIYRAPRHTAVPYTHDKEDKEEKRQKRELRRARASELAQSLRHQYGEAPEQEDYHGGSDYGKQLQAARRFAEREAEKTKYEESAMVRLTTTRKEKKERKRIMRAEVSNLNGIADLSNLARDANRVIDTQGGGGDADDSDRGASSFNTERHANGKRKKDMIDADGRLMTKPKARKGGKSKNTFQAALYGEGGGKKKKKPKRS